MLCLIVCLDVMEHLKGDLAALRQKSRQGSLRECPNGVQDGHEEGSA
jgi:hypothetical protein